MREHGADREAVGGVVGPLASLRERTDRGQPPPDHAEVQRGDGEPAEQSGQRLAAARERPLQRHRPAEREREVDRHRGGEQRQRAPLAREQQGAGGTSAAEHVLAARERDERGRDAAHGGGDEPGLERALHAGSVRGGAAR
jgi:hypothetical protein